MKAVLRFLPSSLCAWALALLLAGCQTGEMLTLDASSTPAKETVASYNLMVLDPAIEKDSLRHQEAEALVKAALAGNGFYESPDPRRADMQIKVDYGIGPGRLELVEIREPIYGSVSGGTTSAPVNITGADGSVMEVFADIPLPPITVVTGEQTLTRKENFYEKRLTLEARRTRAGGVGPAPEDVFFIEVTSDGPSRDLRKTLPVLAAVALEHIGDQTNGRQVVKLTDPEAIAFVKNPANVPK
jgi:hypothetical protein